PDGGINSALVVRQTCDIPLHGDNRTTAESRLQLLHPGCDALQHAYLRAFGEKPLDHSSSYACPSTCHECYFALQPSHCRASLTLRVSLTRAVSRLSRGTPHSPPLLWREGTLALTLSPYTLYYVGTRSQRYMFLCCAPSICSWPISMPA